MVVQVPTPGTGEAAGRKRKGLQIDAQTELSRCVVAAVIVRLPDNCLCLCVCVCTLSVACYCVRSEYMRRMLADASSITVNRPLLRVRVSPALLVVVIVILCSCFPCLSC